MALSLEEDFLRGVLQSDQKIEEISAAIAKDLKQQTYDITVFVEAIGFALSSPKVDLRVNGTKLLSSTLMNIPKDLLSESRLSYLVTFYCERLKDQHNVIPHVLDGFCALIAMEHLPNGSVSKFLESFFQHTTCQSQMREDRHKVYTIFQTASDRFADELKSVGGDYGLIGVINSIDGERDPRNLDFIFGFMPDYIRKVPLLHLAEEMFEIFACYFPIDFNPSKNDPSFVSREKLAEKLANCLVASDEFVPWAVSLLLEKLESDLIVAKLDSLHLLIRSTETFPPKLIEPYFDQIWTGLKSELLPGTGNGEIIASALHALKTLLERASLNAEVSVSYQTTILGTILPHLNDASHRLFNPSSSIALVCVSGDPRFASHRILNGFLLILKSANYDNEQRLKFLSVISQVFKICTAKNVLKEVHNDEVDELQVELVNILKNELSTNLDTIKATLRCFQEGAAIVSEDNRTTLYEVISKILTDDEMQIDLRELLKVFAELYPFEQLHEQSWFSKLLRNFAIFPVVVKQKIYFNLSELLPLEHFQPSIMALITNNAFGDIAPEQRILALNALKSALETQDTKFVQKIQSDYGLIENIVTIVQSSTFAYETLESFSTVLNLIVRKLAVHQQKVYIDKYLPKMNLQLAADLFLAKGMLGFMHTDVDIDTHFERLLNDLTTLSLQSEDESVRLICHHLICSLLNKVPDNEKNRGLIEKILSKLKAEIESHSEKAVEILSWIAKGLSVRGYSSAADIIDSIAQLLDHPSLSTAASLGFEIISVEFPELHLPVVKFLYKQKLFHIILKRIGDKLTSYSKNHLNAFAYVLQATPHKVLKMNLEKIGPVIFQCLDLDKAKTLCIALKISENFVKEKDEYFRSHLNHLIPQCLKLSEFTESMHVRIASLTLIGEIANYPTFVLLPYKFDVVLALSHAVDDKKRIVRAAAVKARNLWYLIGSPSGE